MHAQRGTLLFVYDGTSILFSPVHLKFKHKLLVVANKYKSNIASVHCKRLTQIVLTKPYFISKRHTGKYDSHHN